MFKSKSIIIGLLIVIAAVTAIFFVVLNDSSPDDVAMVPSPTPVTTIEPAALPSSTPPSVNFPAYSGDPIQNIGSDPFINTLPPQIVEREKKYIAQMANSLGENPIDYGAWIGIGTTKKLFRNYKGAIDAWEYAKAIAPTHPLSYLNLAELYGYFLKDVKKAEENYLVAVANDNVNANGAYYAIANFYRDFGFKDKAIEYYTKLLEFMPNDPAVLTELERFGAKP